MTPVATAEEESATAAEDDATVAADPAPQTELVPDPTPPADADYGSGAALSGPIAVVGAPGEGSSGTVRVFEIGDDNSATQVGMLEAEPGQHGFGKAVATDGSLIVVGAPGTAHSGTEAVDIYDPLTLALIKELDGNDAGSNTMDFGAAVAIDGDWLVVGAPGAGEGDGAVFIYLRAGGLWADTPYQSLSGLGGSGFGQAVAIKDGKIVIGAPFEVLDEGGAAVGAAHVYELAEGVWVEVGAALRDSDPVAGGRFGSAVAIDGDLIAVGSPGESGGFAGRVVVFNDPYGDDPASQSIDGDSSGSLFGRSVALDSGRLAVGGLASDSSGYVNVYGESATALAAPTLQAATPSFTLQSSHSGTGPGDNFGRTLSGSGGKILIGGGNNAYLAGAGAGGGSGGGGGGSESGGDAGVVGTGTSTTSTGSSGSGSSKTGGSGSGGRRVVPVPPRVVHPEGEHHPAGRHGKHGAVHGAGHADKEHAEHHGAAHGEGHPTDRSSFAERLLSPAQLDLSFTNLAEGGLLAFLLAALLYLPVIIFNKTTERNHESIAAFWAPLNRRVAAITAFFAFLHHPLLLLLLTGVVSGALFAFVEPGFPTEPGALPYLIGMILGFTFVGAVFFGSWRAVVHRLEPESEGRWRLYPPYILLALVLIAFARLASFLPGVVLGTLAEYEPGKRLSERTAGLRVLVTYAILLVVGMAAWFIWPSVEHAASEEGASTLTLIGDAALAATFVTALESMVFGLLPLKFLDGHELWTWHKGLWFALWIPSLYWFAMVILHPALSTYNHHSSTTSVFWLALLFSGLMLIALSTWAYFAWKDARLARAESQV